jgi:small-conductance mechanosensitive channel
MNIQTYYPPSDFNQAGGILTMAEIFQGLTISGLITTIIMTVAIIFFFWSVILYVWKLRSGHVDEDDRKRISWAIILLTVMVSMYGFIYLARQIFGLQDTGVNQSIPFKKVNF